MGTDGTAPSTIIRSYICIVHGGYFLVNFPYMNSISPYPFWVRIELPCTVPNPFRCVWNCLNAFLFTSLNSLDNFLLALVGFYLLCGYNTGDSHYSNSFLISPKK